MTRQEALEIIVQEKLQGYNLNDGSIRANEVGLQYSDNKWKVYEADEKANCRIIEEYDAEEDAIMHVIECLRINKRLEERRKRKKDNSRTS